MNYLKPVICVLLSLSLVGCAVSRNPNPVIRYGANTGTTLAVPGLVGAVGITALAAALDDDDDSDCHSYSCKSESQKKATDDYITVMGISLGIAGIGFVAGAVLGGTVGFFKWMFNGFKDDDIEEIGPLPEDILPPAKPDNEYGSKIR
jgi:hypothetical protein